MSPFAESITSASSSDRRLRRLGSEEKRNQQQEDIRWWCVVGTLCRRRRTCVSLANEEALTRKIHSPPLHRKDKGSSVDQIDDG